MISNPLPTVLLLAAGYGSRLKPLTDFRPKPLIEIAGKPLLQWHLELLAVGGFKKVFINLHHLGQQIVDFVGDGSSWGLEVVYSWEAELLDTGGALKPLAPYWESDSLLIINSDSFFLDQPDLRRLLDTHTGQGRSVLATLLLREDPEASRYGSLHLAVDGQITKFLDKYPPGVDSAEDEQAKFDEIRELMYCGIMVVSKRVTSFLPNRAVSSLTKDVLIPALTQGEYLQGICYSGRWFDVGTVERLKAAEEAALE